MTLTNATILTDIKNGMLTVDLIVMTVKKNSKIAVIKINRGIARLGLVINRMVLAHGFCFVKC